MATFNGKLLVYQRVTAAVGRKRSSNIQPFGALLNRKPRRLRGNTVAGRKLTWDAGKRPPRVAVMAGDPEHGPFFLEFQFVQMFPNMVDFHSSL